MKFLDNKAHGALDYITVVSFALIPSIFGLTGIPACLSYALAAIHLLMTALTDFDLGIVKKIPVKFHKLVEMAVGPILIVAPWLLGFSEDAKARVIFIVAGLVILLVGQVSRYRQP
jgi:hypothetical protein